MNAALLEMIIEGGLMKSVLAEPVISEADQLVAIMTSARITSGKNQQEAKGLVSRNRQPKIKTLKSKI